MGSGVCPVFDRLMVPSWGRGMRKEVGDPGFKKAMPCRQIVSGGSRHEGAPPHLDDVGCAVFMPWARMRRLAPAPCPTPSLAVAMSALMIVKAKADGRVYGTFEPNFPR